MTDFDWKMVEAFQHATLIALGTMAELLIASKALDRQALMGALQKTAAEKIATATPLELQAKIASNVLLRFVEELAEGFPVGSDSTA